MTLFVHAGGSARTGQDAGDITHSRTRDYLRPYLRWLQVLDLVVIALAVTLAQLARFGWGSRSLPPSEAMGTLSYTSVSAALVLGWLVMLHLQDAYDGRISGHGVQEYRQVLNASLWLFGVLAIVAFAFKLDFARGYVLLAFPLGTMLLLLGRWASRQWLVRQRRAGALSDRVLLVGDHTHVGSLVKALKRFPDAGYDVLGACVADPRGDTVAGVPVVGTGTDVVAQAQALRVDVVAVSSSAGLGVEGLRRLGWALEGTAIELVVAPDIMDVAGPRVKTRPVQGLPLIHVESPRFAGPQLAVKSVMDRTVAVLALVLLSPVLLAVATAIWLEDRGPYVFRQERVGRQGERFRMFKFRSMVPGAETRLPELLSNNEADGPLFKMHADPRVTRVGAFIRRYSLDELPQLVNVARGEMSLVGPRPPLPHEVDAYGADVRRRLLVKPGLTGLWQISGRSDLKWDEAVRLDLYYVENWTPVLDLMILWRTLLVVVQASRAGAY
jgi:exopolysaccharide biosynthesis polyprenyl glycosylphosphotransferase